MHKLSNEGFLNRYGEWALVAGAAEGIGESFTEALAKKRMNLRKKAICIPGWKNRLPYCLLIRIIPRRVSARFVWKAMGKIYPIG